VGERADGAAAYEERLSAPLGTWAAVYGITLMVVPVVLALLPPVGVLLVTVAAYALVTLAVRRWEPTVAVVGGELRAGRAHIPVGLLGEPVALDAAAAAYARGRGWDPGAHHLVRPWVPTAVLVPVEDPDDPTTAWYVATRDPAALATALRSSRAAAAT
jgi:hypothetical protein